MDNTQKNVAVLGASPKPERYSNKAIRMLLEAGHTVIPVHPALETVEGLRTANGLECIKMDIDTLTVYVSPRVSSNLTDKILNLNPERVIFNPGAENTELEQQLESKGIKCEEACTLVLLKTGQF